MLRIFRSQNLILLGCTLLLSQTLTAHAFVDMVQLDAAVKLFLEAFEMHGGREFVRRIEEGEPIEAQDFKDLDDIFDIKCLLSVVRINKYPRPLTYEPNYVCLTDDNPKFPCLAKNQIQFTHKLHAKGSQFRYLNGDSGQSENIQGVYWLDYGFTSGGALVSFAESNDPGTCQISLPDLFK